MTENDPPDERPDQSLVESQSITPIIIPVIVQNINDNQVKVETITVSAPGASVETELTLFARFFIGTGKGLLWIAQNPEWALKWALTILAIKLFLNEGFTLESLKKIRLSDDDKQGIIKTMPTTKPRSIPSSKALPPTP